MVAPKRWDSIATSLAITKEAIDTHFIHGTLRIEEDSAEHSRHIYWGPNWWTYTYDDKTVGTLEEQVSLLVHRVRPLLGQVTTLLETGHWVQVAISGSVETGSQLLITPPTIEQLARLSIPVSFTVLTSANMAEGDPMGWLDA